MELWDKGAAADAVNVPAGLRQLIVGPWDTVAPTAWPSHVEPVADKAKAIVVSGWFLSTGGNGVWVRLEELGGGLSTDYAPHSWLHYLNSNETNPTPFHLTVHARAFQFVFDNPHGVAQSVNGVIVARNTAGEP